MFPNTYPDLHYSKRVKNLANKFHLNLIIFNLYSQFIYLQIFSILFFFLFILGHTHTHFSQSFLCLYLKSICLYLFFIFSPFLFVSIGQPMINRLPCMINKYSINLIYGHPLSYPNANISKTQTSMKRFINFHTCIVT